MIYPAKVITAPATEPVSIEDLKLHLRVDGSTEDVLIESMGKAARLYVEWRSGKTLMETVYEQVSDDFPRFGGRLRLSQAAPLQSVTWVRYTNSAGTVTTWSTAEYTVNTDSEPGFILPAYGYGYPSFVPYPSGAVRVRYVAGPAASPLTYPDDDFRHAIKLLVAGMYENRESEIITDRAVIEAIAMKYGVEGLIGRQRVDFAF